MAEDRFAPPGFEALGGELRIRMIGISATGLRIDEDGRVLSNWRAPIPGLYAAGEYVGGIIGDIYLGSGNSLPQCLTYGRIAGRTAVADLAGEEF